MYRTCNSHVGTRRVSHVGTGRVRVMYVQDVSHVGTGCLRVQVIYVQDV